MLVAVHASPKRRFSLLKERGRKDDPVSREMFVQRDERELGVGIGRAIALADEIIPNEHVTPETLSGQMVRIVERWVKSVGA
jgi:dephospho-CoA kinase